VKEGTLNAGQLMRTDLPSIQRDTPVAEVARLLLTHRAQGLAVTEAGGRYVGTVTVGDVVAKHARPHTPLYLGILGYVFPIETPGRDDELRHVLAVQAADLMSDHAVQVTPATDIDDVSTVMVDHHQDAIAVVEDGQFRGMVEAVDILKLLIQEESDRAPVSPGA
jgi:CBS domain-containing protein